MSEEKSVQDKLELFVNKAIIETHDAREEIIGILEERGIMVGYGICALTFIAGGNAKHCGFDKETFLDLCGLMYDVAKIDVQAFDAKETN